MGELVPFGRYKDQPIERQALTAQPVKILYTSNIIELFPNGPPRRDRRYCPQFPRVDRPNVVPLFNRESRYTLAELDRIPPSLQFRSKQKGSTLEPDREQLAIAAAGRIVVFRNAVRAAINADSTVEAALAYAPFGFPVFPLNPINKTPIPPRDKDESGEPISGTGGHYKATCDEEQIEKWWQRHPKRLIGMPMGPRTGIWAVDVDTGEDHADGVAAWKSLAAEHPAIVTREHRSATGGPHLIFIWDAAHPIACSSGDLPNGIHVKGMAVTSPCRRRSAKVELTPSSTGH